MQKPLFHNTIQKSMSPSLLQLQIGQLAEINREALLPWDRQRAILLLHGEDHSPAAHLVETIALQLLCSHPDGEARLQLYEATPGHHYAHLKRLIIESEGALGEQLYNAATCRERLQQLHELAHRRFALLASAHQQHIAEWNRKRARKETIHYLLITAIDGLADDSHGFDTLQNLCSQGRIDQYTEGYQTGLRDQIRTIHTSCPLPSHRSGDTTISNATSFAHQIELLQELQQYLSDFQERLLGVSANYRNKVDALHGEGGLMDETYRDYVEQQLEPTRAMIQQLVDHIGESDIPAVKREIAYLEQGLR